MKTPEPGSPRHRFYFVCFALFFVATLFLGGASRADTLSQPVIRVVSIVFIAVIAASMRGEEWRRVRLPAMFLLAAMAFVAIQLVPLPPDLWAQLPGRALYREAIEIAGLTPRWRPISLTPDLTLNSLLALLPALAAVLGLGMIESARYPSLLPFILGAILISILLGLLQISQDHFYLYQVTNLGSAVGVFANRNHQALLLACAFPLLACWSVTPSEDESYRGLRTWLALCFAAAIFPVLLVTGSRAGIALGLIGFAGAALLTLGGRRFRLKGVSLVRLIPLFVGIGAAGGAIYLSRAEALRRLIAGEEFEKRSELLPVFVRMAKDFFPFGSGYGSFDPVFRAYEPDAALNLTYLNHAHNELAETLIEGGLLSATLLAALLGWLLWSSWRLWSRKPRTIIHILGRTGTIILFLSLLASLVDYPLRTPLLSVLFAMACVWIVAAVVEIRGGQDKGLAGLPASANPPPAAS